MIENLIGDVREVDDALRSHTATYYNTTPFFQIQDRRIGRYSVFDITDMILLGALTNSDLLLSSKTGSGKSHLSRMAMNGLYGAGNFANLTVTPGLSESDFIDIDIAAIKKGEKSLKEAIEKTALLVKPGATIHEINRTPEILQNMFISYLERIFSLKGIEFPVGVPLDETKFTPQDSHYQFRIVSINEGDYAGTSGIDAAVRDRVVLEIPMDNFRPTQKDIRNMVNTRNNADLTVDKANGGKFHYIKGLVLGMPAVPMSASAEEFLVYLSGLNNCIKSLTYSKTGIAFSPKDLCTGCKHTKDQATDKENMCPSVYAPSDRSLINLKKISKAVALLRAYKTIDAVARGEETPKDARGFIAEYLRNLQVGIDDLAAVAPFILTSKMQMDPRWVGQHFQGSKYLATQHVVNTALEKYKRFVQAPVYTKLIGENGIVTPEVRSNLETYAKDADPWAYNLGDKNSTQTRPERKVDFDKLF